MRERTCQHDAAITHPYKNPVNPLSLDVTVIAALLIMVSEQAVLGDKLLCL